MADQKNRGGQKVGKQEPSQSQKHQGTTERGQRDNRDKRNDQQSNKDDDRRRATNEQR